MNMTAEWLLTVGSELLNKTEADATRDKCGQIFSDLVKSAGRIVPASEPDAAELLSMLGKPGATRAEQDRMIALAVLIAQVLPEPDVRAADNAIYEAICPDPHEGLDPRFIAAGEALAEITEREGEDAIHDPKYAGLMAELMMHAPAHIQAKAREFLPKPTHRDAEGNPLYSLEQISEHLGEPVDELRDRLAEGEGLGLPGEHTGPVFPIH